MSSTPVFDAVAVLYPGIRIDVDEDIEPIYAFGVGLLAVMTRSRVTFSYDDAPTLNRSDAC